MNKKTFCNPQNPYHTVTTSDLMTARLYKSLGWQEKQVTITPKGEAKKP